MEFVTQHPVLVVSLIKIAIALFVVMTALAYLTWFERKVVARIQSRWGPYWVGPHGLLQPLADGVKFLFKEDIVPPMVDKVAYVLAPFLALAIALTTLALIPIGPATINVLGQPTQLVISHSNIALILLFAISSIGIYAVVLAGWSSNSKYPLMGGLRSSAQMISYELPLSLAIAAPLLLSNTLSLHDLVVTQEGGIWHWNVLRGPFPQIFSFVIFLIAAFAETNRVPFDLPEAENELVAGFHVEYSSMKFASFFMAEYCNMITVSSMATLLFLGGWTAPWPAAYGSRFVPVLIFALAGVVALYHGIETLRRRDRLTFPVFGVVFLAIAGVFLLPMVQEWLLPLFWFCAKTGALLFAFMWIRGTLPRFRYDQLMGFTWKFLFPVAMLNLLVTGLLVAWFS